MSLVLEFSHLKGRRHEEKALPMLQRVASLVKPIMKNHSWKLPLLAEFFPDDPNLVGLNVNSGQKILLRLRPAHAPDTFYDEEQIIGTMLHELTHNAHGPHDAQFYAFLNKLEDEYDALRRGGYSGEGFHSKGTRLGVGVSHDVPLHQGRLKAALAAEERAKRQRLIGKGGRLGGSSQGTKNKSPRELAAEAAERRARDAKACGVGVRAEEEAAKAAKQGVKSAAIDLDPPPSEPVDVPHPMEEESDRESSPDIVLLGSRPAASSPPSTNHFAQKMHQRTSSSNSVVDGRARAMSNASVTDWTCPACTLLNSVDALQCAVCETWRPIDPITAEGWICMFCGALGNDHQFWSCRSCGWVKTDSSVRANV